MEVYWLVRLNNIRVQKKSILKGNFLYNSELDNIQKRLKLLNTTRRIR